jgi:glyoxylase-like metal-dependent hydrolase (beta-lactamase superfamily II)
MAGVNLFSAETNIFSYKVGNIEVSTMVENRGQGRTSVLVNPIKEDMQKYLPAETYQSEVNTFLVKTQDQIILIDTGFGTTLFDNLKALHVSPDQIDAVLLTHTHGDHINGLSKDGKALFPNAKVYLAVPEKDFFASSASASILVQYGNNVETFEPKELGNQIEDLLPGIKAVSAFGHTPGHTMFMISSEGKMLLVWGDLVHVEDIQIPVPGQSVSYDSDTQAAANVRNRVFEYVSRNNIPVAGMHLRYPAMGFLASDGTGVYTFMAAK